MNPTDSQTASAIGETGQIGDEAATKPFQPSEPPTAGERSADLRDAFGERYVTQQSLGHGGFGSVFEALDTRLNRRVAIKASPIATADADQLLREARALAQLHHPGIVAVYDVAVSGRHCFIVSELLPGPNLSTWLQAKPSHAEAVRVAAEVADALAHAHSRTVIHRDVKPSNIVFAENRRPVLVDFGLALTEMDAASERGKVSGTPAFMAPEQAKGEAHRPDGRTDIYGLAATLYAILCGRPPFRGSTTLQVLQQVREDEPQPPRQINADIPAELERVLMKGMAKHPTDRFTTARDFAEALRQTMGVPAKVATAPAPTPTAPAPKPTTARAERRQITLLNCVCEEHAGEDDDPLEHLAVFLAVCREETLAHGGLPLQTSGSSFLGCFGYPTAREDAPHQAIRTGLAIRKRVQTIAVHSAVGTGIAHITQAANAPPVVVGDVMSMVGALSAQGGGGVVINETTAQLIAGYFDCESAGEVRTRGSAPTAVMRVLAERAVRSRIEAADPSRLTPLVGRNREVELLRERWDQACEGLRNVILLVADPGIGKSRLVRVLRESVLQPGAKPATVIEFFASPYHAGSPFYPVIDYFDRQFELSRESDPVKKLDRLLTNLLTQGIREPEQQALFAAMLSIPAGERLPGLALSPEKQKAKTLEALLTWLMARTEQSPVLFVVEDLHWIDPSTEELLTEFVERGGESRILGLFTFRPEYDPPWKGKAVQTQVALNRLTRNQVVEMMRAQTGETAISQVVVDQIVERTDGVPLFVEEFTKLLAEGAKWTTGVGTAIPTTLQDLLLARLDRMASVREVVQLGAVIGRTFSFELLRVASDLGESILKAELEKLVGAGLLFAKGAAPGTSFTFKHALIQDAAYQSLVKKQRQLFHRMVAEALERAFPEVAATQPELLAHHFTEAGESAKAVAFWLLAGQRAREQSAHVEAIRHLSRGLELLLKSPADGARDGGELPFRMMLAASCIAVHGYAADIVEEHIQAARALCERLGAASPLFHVMMIIWAVRFIRGLSDLAETTSGEIFAEAAKRDASYQTEAHWTGTSTIWWAGDFEKSLQLSTRGMELYTVESSQQHAAILQQNCGPLMTTYRAWGFWMLGFAEQARKVQNEALALAELLKDRFLIVATKWHSGFHTFLEGRHAETLACMNEVIAASEEGSYAFWIALGRGIKGAVLVLDRPAEAAVLLTEALAKCDAIGSGILHTVFLGALADAHWALGQRPEAWAALDRAQDHNDRLGQRAYEAELLRRRAKFSLDESNRTAVEGFLLRAIAVAQKQKAIVFELRAAIDLAKLCGNRAPVASLYGTFTEGFDSPDLIAAREFLASPV